MSKFSGKCDLYDYLSMQKTYEVPGGYDSDEMECFEIFKRKTKGILYKTVQINLNRYNIDEECRLNSNLTKIEHTSIVDDKRYNSKKRSKVSYTYKYYKKEYKTLKEINKLGYFREIEIHFKTILDLIPYYPYLISYGTSSNGTTTIIISNESYVDTQEKMMLDHGYSSKMISIYKEELQNHYRDICLKYLDPLNRDTTEKLKIFKQDDKLYVKPSFNVDYNFKIEVVRDLHNWIYSNPKYNELENPDIIDVTDIWPNELKEDDFITIKYIKK